MKVCVCGRPIANYRFERCGECRIRALREARAKDDGLLVFLRAKGLTWPAIGARLGVSRQAAAQRHERALRRVLQG